LKKSVAIIVLVILCLQPLIANYTPYSPDEFPQWSLKLRRAETLLFGSLPITIGVTSLSYAAALSFGATPFSSDVNKETLAIIGIASALSLAVALADYIIGEMQK